MPKSKCKCGRVTRHLWHDDDCPLQQNFFGNQAIGGAGGSGASGGNGTGGAIFCGISVPGLGASGSVVNCLLAGNVARGGAGGLGGNGRGITHGAGTLTVSQTTITGNKAQGGAAGSGGLAGRGTGGGVFNNRGVIAIDAVDLIFGTGPLVSLAGLVLILVRGTAGIGTGAIAHVLAAASVL